MVERELINGIALVFERLVNTTIVSQSVTPSQTAVIRSRGKERRKTKKR